VHQASQMGFVEKQAAPHNAHRSIQCCTLIRVQLYLQRQCRQHQHQHQYLPRLHQLQVPLSHVRHSRQCVINASTKLCFILTKTVNSAMVCARRSTRHAAIHRDLLYLSTSVCFLRLPVALAPLVTVQQHRLLLFPQRQLQHQTPMLLVPIL